MLSSAGFLKRIGAYLIDILIILLVSNIFNNFLPNNSEKLKLANENNDIITKYFSVIGENDEEEKIYGEKVSNYSYELSKLSIYSNLLMIVLYFLYFIVFQSYNNGQTIGKKILKIEVVSEDDKEVSFKQLLIRGLILFPIVFNLLNIIALLIFKQSIYENISFVLSLAKYTLFLTCFISIIVSKRGIHDRIAGTSVVISGSSISEVEGKALKWKRVAEKEKDVKKYRTNHTSGKRKE